MCRFCTFSPYTWDSCISLVHSFSFNILLNIFVSVLFYLLNVFFLPEYSLLLSDFGHFSFNSSFWPKSCGDESPPPPRVFRCCFLIKYFWRSFSFFFIRIVLVYSSEIYRAINRSSLVSSAIGFIYPYCFSFLRGSLLCIFAIDFFKDSKSFFLYFLLYLFLVCPVF